MILVPASGIAAWGAGIEAAAGVHETSVNALMLLALGHAAMGLFHHYVWKDGTLTRMVKASA